MIFLKLQPVGFDLANTMTIERLGPIQLPENGECLDQPVKVEKLAVVILVVVVEGCLMIFVVAVVEVFELYIDPGIVFEPIIEKDSAHQ